MKFKDYLAISTILFFLTLRNCRSEIIELEPIVVTPLGREILLRDCPINTFVLDKEDIHQPDVQDVGDILNQAPGVYVNEYGGMGSASGIRLRGFYATHVLVLIDGNPVNTPSLGSANLSLYPIDSIEKIEIVKGPASSLYGTNALGGVINLITQEPPKKAYFDFTSSYGSFDTQIQRVIFGSSFEKMGYLITTSYNKTHGHRQNSSCQGKHFSGKLKLDLTDISYLSFYNSYSEQEYASPGSTLWPTPLAKLDDRIYHSSLSYGIKFDEDNKFLSKFYYDRSWEEYRDPADPWAGNVDNIIKNYKIGLKLQQNFRLNDKNLITLGAEFQSNKAEVKDKITDTSKIGGIKTLNSKAFFIEDEIYLIKELAFNLGLRYDYYSLFGSQISPRVGIIYKLGEDTRLRASIGKAFRAPSINDLYWDDPWMKGNPNLKPEKSIGYEIGLEHKFNKKFSTNVILFRNDVDNLILWADPDGDWVYNPYNISKARSIGLESEFIIQVTDNLLSKISYNYIDAKERGTEYAGKYLIRQPSHQFMSGFNYRHKSGIEIDFNTQYIDRRYEDRANTKELKSYILLNARLSKDISDFGEIFLSIDNITDKRYEIYQNYPMPGRAITIGCRLKF